jgi:hypothetical protein
MRSQPVTEVASDVAATRVSTRNFIFFIPDLRCRGVQFLLARIPGNTQTKSTQPERSPSVANYSAGIDQSSNRGASGSALSSRCCLNVPK